MLVKVKAMRIWGLCFLVYFLVFGVFGHSQAASASSYEQNQQKKVKVQKSKKKSHKSKKKKSKKRKHKKHKNIKKKLKKSKKKAKIYSEHHIERILKNDEDDKICNRLNCASKLEIAKSCLKTKALHRKNKKCFRAFCAYGCNEEDYATRPDVYDFCNKKCSSKKYLKNKKRPVVTKKQG